MNVQTAVDFHDKIAGDWEQKYARPAFQARELALCKCLDGLVLPGQRWLDAGCGTGRLARLLAMRGCQVHGVDASPAMIQVAAEQAAQSGLAERLTFERIDSIESINLPPGDFDGVLCISVLEYLQLPIEAVKRCAAVLRLGGAFVAAVPNRRSLVRRSLATTYGLTKMIRGEGWPGYFEFSRHEYSRDSFFDLLSLAGLEPIRSFYFGGPLPRHLQRLAFGGSLMMCVARKQSSAH